MKPIDFTSKRRDPSGANDARKISGAPLVIDLSAIADERMRRATAAACMTSDAAELLRVFDEMAVEIEAEALAGVRAALARLREELRRRIDLAAKMYSR
jgi:hypothetical protein